LVGIDQSARGTAAVALVDGALVDLMYYADNKTAARSRGNSARSRRGR